MIVVTQLAATLDFAAAKLHAAAPALHPTVVTQRTATTHAAVATPHAAAAAEHSIVVTACRYAGRRCR